MTSGSGGRLIAITGVTSGIGLLMVEKFYEMGHIVLGCGRNNRVIEELNAKYPAFEGGNKFSRVDVSSDREVREWIKSFISAHGCPTIFLNNAAILNKRAEVWNVPVTDFDNLIDINIKGTANCIRHIVPRMMENGKGVIVNLSSGWGRSVSPHVGPYCCSKWAIEGLTKSLALELPSPLTTVALNPGVINTDMLQTAYGVEAASQCQSPTEWATKTCPYILTINRDHNGQSLTAP